MRLLPARRILRSSLTKSDEKELRLGQDTPALATSRECRYTEDLCRSSNGPYRNGQPSSPRYLCKTRIQTPTLLAPRHINSLWMVRSRPPGTGTDDHTAVSQLTVGRPDRPRPVVRSVCRWQWAETLLRCSTRWRYEMQTGRHSVFYGENPV